MQNLRGKIALVTGASRGVGRGIAVGLARRGATVIATGRTAAGKQDPFGYDCTLEETAERIEEAGGTPVAIPCDHGNDEEVAELFERIKKDYGRLDVLANNAWSGYEALHTGDRWKYASDFWEQPIRRWDEAFHVGVRGAYVCSWHAAKLMVPQRSGLIVNVSFWVAERPDADVAYAGAKAASVRLTADMAHALRDHGIVVVALYPGLVRTEGVLRAAEAGYFDLANSESPEFQGLAVAALAMDPKAMAKSGRALGTAEIALEYGFTDIDQKQPLPLRNEYLPQE